MKNIVHDIEAIASIQFRTGAKLLEGMVLFELAPRVDGRGDVTELWSAPWMRSKGVLQPRHIYQSATDYNVVKAWHVHRSHTDQFAVTRGKLQLVCADARTQSPTFRRAVSLIVGAQRPAFVKIPPGIVHGWKALSAPEAVVLNLQSHVYDPDDELRLPWDSILRDIWEPVFR